jgi:hypothetical protein
LYRLTFVALTFFLVELLKRYNDTALPLFRDRETKLSARLRRKPNPPESQTIKSFSAVTILGRTLKGAPLDTQAIIEALEAQLENIAQAIAGFA